MLRDRLIRWATPRRVDVVVALGLVFWALPELRSWWQPGGQHSVGGWLGTIAFAVAQGAPFLFRRRFPLPLLLYSAALLAVHHGTGHAAVPTSAAVLVAAYGLGAYGALRTRRVAWGAAGAALLAAVVFALGLSGDTRNNPTLALTLFAAATLAGHLQATRQQDLAAAAENARDAERARIARELHDILSHQLTAIALHATGTRMAAGGTAEDAPNPVEHLAREALSELDQLLGLLRRHPDQTALRAPLPSLDALDPLLQRTHDAGTPVTLTVTGQRRPVSDAIQLTAYRIMQEALTNVTKHAPAASTHITLDYGATCLSIGVINEACPARGSNVPPARPGRGLAGMRERAALHGGTIRTGFASDGGFRVTATLPYQSSIDRNAIDRITT